MKGGLHARRALTALQSKTHYQRGGVSARGGRNKGFTIVEVLIVLAITGGLFISAATMISGRTAKTQFEQSINQMTGQIRQQINDVASGYYPNNANFECKANGADFTITAGAKQQGTNSGCVFLGKALYFGVTGTDPEQYVSFPVAALQRNAAGDEITSIAAAKPAVIYPAAPQANSPNASQTTPLQYGLKVSKMYYGTNSSNAIGAVAFLSSLGQYNGTELVSGSQQISMLPLLNTSINKSIGEAATAINANFITSNNTFAGSTNKEVNICFDSGTTTQSGLVTIGGGNGRELSVTLSIKGNLGC
jgi:prepilin-type N-terminal cleavage/methylation domain-containing protein